MKKILLLFLFGVINIVSFSLSCVGPPEYKVENGKIHYYGHSSDWNTYNEDTKLDLDLSKKVRLIHVGAYEIYAMDNDNVYYLGELIKEADSETFKSVGFVGMSKDKNNVYYKGRKTTLDSETLEVTYKPIKPDPNWGYWCDGVMYTETYKDKNGEYTSEDINKLLQK